MSNHFPAVTLIWFFIWLYKEVTKDSIPKAPLINDNSDKENDSSFPIPPAIEMHPIWKVRCFSNGKLLPNRHLIYYCDMLELPGNISITDESIERAAFFRQSLISKIDAAETQPLSRKDIVTAKAYLMDRWLYMTSVN